MTTAKTDSGYFGPGSMMWYVLRNRLIGLAGSRALILQLCRPQVAQGVDDHSEFETAPLKRAINTLRALRTVVFSSKADADRVLRNLGKKHGCVSGIIAAETSMHHAGSHYSAAEQPSKLWVLASLADTVYYMHERLVGPLSPNHAVELWRDWQKFGALFHVDPDIMPASDRDFRRYMDGMLSGTGSNKHQLVVDAGTVRRLSERLFSNVIAVLTASRSLTWGLLPPRMRPLAVQRWGGFISIRHKFVFAIVRLLARFVPRQQRYDAGYLRMLALTDATAPGLDPWERAYSKRNATE